MDQIDLVRSKTDIVDLINSYIPLKKAGRNYKANCPFHSESTPSFIVSSELQIFKCFGCGEAGDVYGWLMKYEGMEFGEALRFLADKAGVKLEKFKPSAKQAQKERLYEVNHLASEFYHYVLTQLPAGKMALQYVLKRGISRQTLKDFKLGFAPEQWGGLSDFLLKKKRYQADDLIQAGLGIKGQRGVYDRFRGRLIFPIFDHRGQIIAFAGRVLDKAREKEGKYINSPETLIYHKSASLYGLYQTRSYLKKAKKAVVVEGEFDLLSSYQAGVKNVVAIKGSAFTPEQIELLGRYVEALVLALDADVAGEKATLKTLELTEEMGLDVRVVNLSGKKDPDELAQAEPKRWRQLVKASISVYDFYIQTAQRRYGTKSGEAKKKIGQLVLPVLAKINNEVMKAHYLNQLAEVLGVDEETVDKELAKIKVGASSKPVPKAVETKNRQQQLEDYILSLALKAGLEIKIWLQDLDLNLISQPGVKKLLSQLQVWLKHHSQYQIEAFVASLAPELQPLAQEGWLKEEALTEDKLTQELDQSLKQLCQLSTRQQLTALTEKIKLAETAKNQEKIKQLQTKFTQLTQQLKAYL